FFSSRRRHTRSKRDWSSDVCSSDLVLGDPCLRVFFQHFQVPQYYRQRSTEIVADIFYLLLKCFFSSLIVNSFLPDFSQHFIKCKIGRASCRERGCREGRDGSLEVRQ